MSAFNESTNTEIIRPENQKKVAVILCGSGYLDGSEIREAVGTLWALSQHPIANVKCFAPDLPQKDVVNHLNGEGISENRNLLIEAARIARGKIQPLKNLDPKEFAAIIIPGGFGAAKNLCTFAYDGKNAKVLPELKSILEAMHADKKPIGAICIAPAILALAFKGRGLELTVGSVSDASKAIEELGHKHIVTAPNGCHVDPSSKVVTTPAYMYGDAPIHKIFIGIQKLVGEVVKLM